jgi:thiamine biosynthesis lipoprotein
MPSSPPVRRFAHEAMTTTFELMLVEADAAYARQASLAFFAEIDRLEKILSRFDPCSEISQINRLRPGESVAVGRDAFDCLLAARQACEATGGRFDPTVGPLLRYWKQEHARPGSHAEGAFERALAAVGMDRILFAIDGEDATPGAPETPGAPHRYLIGLRPEAGPDAPGVEIDLGAIGKGYALDKAWELLADWKIELALLSSGGSTVLAVGEGPDPDSPAGGWRLGVGGLWAKPGDVQSVRLRNFAMSGSGTEVKGEHILDPRTGKPGRKALQAWSLGPSATLSDALSTALIMMTPEEIEAYCQAHPVDSAYVVYPKADGGHETRMFGEFFEM